MALVRGKVLKIVSLFAARAVNLRQFSNTAASGDIKKSVFISQSTDIYTNLALENWLYTNFDFNNHQVLLISQNDPCVVIGADQNPWIDTNHDRLTNADQACVRLARRQCDGKSIYQDQGNLNLTFFSTRRHSKFDYNLELITRAMFREYSMKMQISSDKDLLIRNSKISNTSAKLGSDNAYHQCSLMVNVNKGEQENALFKNERSIDYGKYINLIQENYKVTDTGLISAIGWEYMRTQALSLKDGGHELAKRQHGFQMINPTERWFPGITEMRDELLSWEWIYGKTPTFQLSRSFLVSGRLVQSELSTNLNVTLTIENGKIRDVTIFVPPGLSKSGYAGEVNVITRLKGREFSMDALSSLEDYLRGSNDYNDDKEVYIPDCDRQVMTSV